MGGRAGSGGGAAAAGSAADAATMLIPATGGPAGATGWTSLTTAPATAAASIDFWVADARREADVRRDRRKRASLSFVLMALSRRSFCLPDAFATAAVAVTVVLLSSSSPSALLPSSCCCAVGTAGAGLGTWREAIICRNLFARALLDT